MPPSPPDSPRAAPAETLSAGSPVTPRNPHPAVRRVASGELFGPATELVIVHGEREYRLRVTSNGKLILTA